MSHLVNFAANFYQYTKVIASGYIRDENFTICEFPENFMKSEGDPFHYKAHNTPEEALKEYRTSPCKYMSAGVVDNGKMIFYNRHPINQ